MTWLLAIADEVLLWVGGGITCCAVWDWLDGYGLPATMLAVGLAVSGIGVFLAVVA